jgi:DNA-binding NtrC family response regulator
MNRRVQVVEDDEDIRYVVAYLLEDANYTVETFENASAFYGRTKKENVDLIILDVRLPDGNGIDISKAIKNDANTSKIPVIIMSAHAQGDVALNQGKANAFIQKPFDLDFFVSKVSDVMSQQAK